MWHYSQKINYRFTFLRWRTRANYLGMFDTCVKIVSWKFLVSECLIYVKLTDDKYWYFFHPRPAITSSFVINLYNEPCPSNLLNSILIDMYSYIENMMHPKEASSIDIKHNSSIVRIQPPLHPPTERGVRYFWETNLIHN